jgi:gliding motility-associated-like protein
MRFKHLLFYTIVCTFFSTQLVSQAKSKSIFGSFFSPDSLRGFDEALFSQIGLQDGLFGEEFKVYMSNSKREFILNKFYPNHNSISNFKINSFNSVFAAPCVNEGFESGNFTGWVTTIGTNVNSCAYPTANTPVVPGGSTLSVVGTPLFDATANATIPNSPLGGALVAKINDNNPNGKVIKLTQNFVVTNSNYLYDFAYYAVQNGIHTCCQQPYLFVRLRDCIGNLLACPVFSFNAPSGLCPVSVGTWTNGIPGVQRSNGWQRYSIDLTQYISTCVTVEVMVADCSPTGHFLYTYFDSNCNTMNLTVNGSTNISMPSQTVTPQVSCASTATLTAPGGLNPYLWNGPPLSGVVSNTNQTISTTVAGNYTLIMNPVGVCTPITRIINLQFAPPTTVTPSPATICPGQSSTLTAAGATTYTWNTGGVGSSIVVNPTTTTVYSVTAQTGTCIGTFTTQVTVSPTPTVTIATSDASVCTGGSTTLTASGATNYTWSTGATTSSIVVTQGVPTTYSVIGSSGVCTATSSINIGIYPTPSSLFVNATPTLICAGQNVNLFGSAFNATSYLWFPGGISGNFVTANPISTTIFTLIVANGSCTNSAQVTVSVNPGPTLTPVAAPAAICQGFSSTLTATGALAYTWNPGGTISQSIVVNPTVTTTYSVSGIDFLGCVNTQTITLTVNPTPTITIAPSSTNVCLGTSATLTASGATNYTWNPGGLVGSNVVVTPTSITTYTIDGESLGCFGQTNITISVTPIPTVTAISSTAAICLGDNSNLTASGATSYTWNPGGVVGNPISVSPASSTIYTVTGDNGSCSSTATVNLTVNPLPTLTAVSNPTAYCVTGTSTLTSTGGISYTWSPGAITGASITVSPASTTNYTVTGTNAFGCASTSTVDVIVNSLPVLTLTASSPTICNGATTTITASGASSYTFNPGGLIGSTAAVSPTATTIFTVTGLSGACLGTETIVITVNPNPTVTAIANPTNICSGQSATLTASGASSYTWQPGGATGTSIIETPLVTTIYTVTGTNGSGCVASETVILNVTPTPTVTASTSPATICVGNSATLSATGAASYTWNPGGITGANFIALPLLTTNYTVTGENGGCTTTETVIVNVNPVPSLTLNGSPATICNGETVTLTAVGASSYTWNPVGLTGNSITDNPTITTTYTVIGADLIGCSSTETIIISVNPTPTLVTISNPTVICSGNSATLSAVGALNYTWNPGGTTGAIIVVNPITTTQYTVSGEDAFGCASTQTLDLIVTPTPTIIASASSPTICSGSSTTLTASGATTYTWNPGAIVGSNIIVSPLGNTTYTVDGENSGCITTATVDVFVNPFPTIAANANPATICSGNTTTLTSTGGVSYTWTPIGLTGSSVTDAPGITTTYTVIGEDAIGCTNTETVTVTVNPSPTLAISATAASICDGASVNLTGSGATNYTWQPGGATTAGITDSPTITTTYTLVGDNSGCVSSETITIVVNPNPTILASSPAPTICAGSQATLSTTGALNYTWNPSGLTGATVIDNPLANTNYTVFGIDINGCAGQATLDITVNPAPIITANATPIIICSGSSSTLNASGAVNYTWSPTGLTGSSITDAPTVTTTYTVTGEDAIGCTNTETVTITVNPTPTISIGASAASICDGGSVNLTGSGATSYSWQPGGALTAGITDSPTITTTYTVTGDNIGCLSTETITIIVNPNPTITAIALTPTICGGNTATLSAVGGVSYTWNPSGLTGATIADNPAITTIYTVTGENSLGCINSGTVEVTVSPSPTVTAASSATGVCQGVSATLTASGAISYTWEPGTVTNSIAVVSPASTTNYTVTGDDGFGCTASQTIDIVVIPNPTLSITASSASLCLGNTLTLTAAGATNYTWLPSGFTTGIITDSPTSITSYTLIGDNGGGCSTFTTITINVNPIPSLTITSTASPTICSGTSYTLTALGANSYTWISAGFTVSPTLIQTPTLTTLYTLLGGDLNGCLGVVGYTQSVSPTPTVVINVSSPTICLGSSATLTASGANTYSWEPGALIGSSVAVSPTVNTTYTLTGTDVAGCTSTQTVDITVLSNTVAVTAATTSTALCAGSSATITASGATNYTIEPGAILGSSAIITPTATTIYTITGTNGGCGGNSTVTLQINVNPIPQNVTANVSGSITCISPSVSLLGAATSTNVNYLWNGPGSFTSNLQIVPGVVVTGNYTLTVSNATTGCLATATVNVIADPSVPTTSVTSSGSITCLTSTVSLSAATSATNAGFAWSGPTGFTATTSSITVSTGGNYTLTVTNLNISCPATTVVTVFTSTYVPITSSVIPATCTGTSTNNNGSIVVLGFVPSDKFDFVSGITYTGTATYPTASSIPVTGIITNTLANPLVNAPYTIRLFGANGCFKDTTVILTPVYCQPNLYLGLAKSVSTPTLQADGSYNLTYTVYVRNSSFANLSNVSITDDLSLTFPLPSTFSIVGSPSLNAGSGLGLNPAFNGGANISLTTPSLSILQSAKEDTIRFTINVKPNGLFGPFNNSATGIANVPLLLISVVDISQVGTDPDPNADGNFLDNNIPTPITFTPNLFFGLTKEGSLSEMLSDKSYDVSYTITVHNLGNDTLRNVVIKDSLFNNTIKLPANYTVKSAPITTGLLAANLGFNGNNDINLLVPSQSKIAPNQKHSVSFIINVVPDTITIIRNSAFGSAISLVGGPVSDTSNTGRNPDTNNNGIWNEEADNVETVLSIPNTSLFIPQGFSPDGDNRNDVWVIKALPQNNKVTVFNRWGNLVYSKENYDNTWNGMPNVSGTFGSDKLPQGTYYYIIEFTDSGNKPMNGFVILQY